MTDVNSDLQQNGLQTYLDDRTAPPRRAMASRPNQIDNVLYDAFGQRTVSTIYNPFNQYYVVMEVAPAVLAVPADARPRSILSTGGRQRERYAADQMPGGTVSGVAPVTAARAAAAATSHPTRSRNANAEANG